MQKRKNIIATIKKYIGEIMKKIKNKKEDMEEIDIEIFQEEKERKKTKK